MRYEIASVYVVLRDLHTVLGIPLVAQNGAIPVRTAPKFQPLPAAGGSALQPTWAKPPIQL